MRSKEIAKLAGVSVRTLRHYHQIGLLPDPPRQANGYRSYGIQHLVRLLRIGQFAALGLRLADLPAFLDGDVETGSMNLDSLDSALVRQIEILERQRGMVAALRQGNGPYDMPPEFVASLLVLEAGRSEPAKKAGREQSVLLKHVVDDDGQKALARLYDRLAAPELAGIALDLGHRFDALGADSNEQEIVALADAYIEHLGPWLREFDSVFRSSAAPSAGSLIWTHALEFSNPQQRRMMAELSGKIGGG
jgi:DNA-binding transcriptional MerR regulator